MKVYAVIVQGSLVEPFTNRAEAMSRRKELDAKGAFLEEVDFSLNKAGILDAIAFANLHLARIPDGVPAGPGDDGQDGGTNDIDLEEIETHGIDMDDDLPLDDDEFDFDLDDDEDDLGLDEEGDEAQQKCCDTCTYVALTKDGQAYCDNELSEFRDKDVDPEISSCELWDSMT